MGKAQNVTRPSCAHGKLYSPRAASEHVTSCPFHTQLQTAMNETVQVRFGKGFMLHTRLSNTHCGQETISLDKYHGKTCESKILTKTTHKESPCIILQW